MFNLFSDKSLRVQIDGGLDVTIERTHLNSVIMELECPVYVEVYDLA